MNFKHFILVGLLGVITLTVILLVSNMGPRELGPDDVYPGPWRKVDVKDILEHYQKNPEGAQYRFAEKGLEVTGILQNYGKDAPYIYIGEELGAGAPGVVCYFPRKEFQQVIDEVKLGEPITVRGLCRGLKIIEQEKQREIRRVFFRGCQLVK